MSGLTYQESGVDVGKGDALVERIKPLAKQTRIDGVMGAIGGFAGFFELPKGLSEPVLVAGTDGVGTKLKLAFELDCHETVGIDLVAMSVNDLITTGARPLFFLDYFATGKLDVDRAARVVSGIADGCKLAGCALLGGETAELPGFYQDGEYDLAGFAVGIVDKAAILDGSTAADGDVLIGVPSSGLHSNGFSLARKALFERGAHSTDAELDGLSENLGKTLLTPTRIYTDVVQRALKSENKAHHGVRGICHITGGGLVGNLPRILPDGLMATITTPLPEPPIFEHIRRAGNINDAEMRTAFNLGMGLVMIVKPETADQVLGALSELEGDPAQVVGHLSAWQSGPRVVYS